MSDQTLINDARLLLATGIPWLSPAVLQVRVLPVRGSDFSSATDVGGTIHLAVDACFQQAADHNVPPAHVAATHLLVCIWRVLFEVDARSELLQKQVGQDAVAWATAADAVCCRTALRTLIHTDAGDKTLPRIPGMATVRGLAADFPIDDPDRIGLEQLYLAIKQPGSSGEEPQSYPPTFTKTADADTPTRTAPAGPSCLEVLQTTVCQEVAKAAEKSPDKLPLEALQFAAEHGHAELDLLHHFRNVLGAQISIADAGPTRTYKRPPRIDDPHLIFPGRAHTVRQLMVAVDTSASMTEPQIKHAFAECAGMAQHRGFEVTYITVSDTVSKPRKLERGAAPIIELGSGTDMRLGFAAFDAQNPDVAVMLTDGESPWPASAPRTRNIIIAIIPELDAGNTAQRTVERVQEQCPWATVVGIPTYGDTRIFNHIG